MRSLIFWLIGMMFPARTVCGHRSLSRPALLDAMPITPPISHTANQSHCQSDLAEPRAREPHQRRIERREKARAVAGRERLRAARDGTGAAQVAHQVAGCERHADGVFRERL